MAGRSVTVGLDKEKNKFIKLGQAIEGISKAALFDGAGAMAGEINLEIANIRTEPFRYAFNGHQRLPSPEEKAALQGTIGIAEFRGSGSEIETVVGPAGDGYADVAGKRTPIMLIARAINGGTSFMKKQPVFRRAASKGAKAAEAAMQKTAEERIEQIANE